MGSYLPGLNFPIYSGWTQYTPVIPKLYWDVYSAEQRMKQLCKNFDKVEHYLDYVSELMNKWNIEFSEELNAELTKMWEEVHNGYEKAIAEWIKNDLPEIVDDAIHMVYFGLTLDGYFVAYIPESWDEIQFDTIMNVNDANYGRLVLSYIVDGSAHDVEQEI